MVSSIALLVASLGVLLVGAAWWIVAVGLYLRLVKGVPGAPRVPRALGGARGEPHDAEMPPAIRQYIEAESEEWAREELRSVAKALYAELGDWDMAFAEMQRTATDLPPGEEH